MMHCFFAVMSEPFLSEPGEPYDLDPE